MEKMKQFSLNLALALALFVGAFVGLIPAEVAAVGTGVLLTTSTAQLGNGTILQISVGSPTAFLTINNATDVAFNNGTSAEVDATNMSSTWKEFLLGLPDGGTLTANVQTDMGDAGQSAAHGAKVSRTKCTIKVILPGGTTPNWVADGFVKKFDLGTGVDAVVKTAFEFRVTGPWTAS